MFVKSAITKHTNKHQFIVTAQTLQGPSSDEITPERWMSTLEKVCQDEKYTCVYINVRTDAIRNYVLSNRFFQRKSVALTNKN